MKETKNNETAKLYFDLGVAKARAYKNAIRSAEEQSSRLLQMELADKLEIRWFIV